MASNNFEALQHAAQSQRTCCKWCIPQEGGTTKQDTFPQKINQAKAKRQSCFKGQDGKLKHKCGVEQCLDEARELAAAVQNNETESTPSSSSHEQELNDPPTEEQDDDSVQQTERKNVIELNTKGS